MKKYIILYVVILFVACQQKSEKPIESIEVLYYNGIFARADAVRCKDIVYKTIAVKDTSIEYTEDGYFIAKGVVILDTVLTDKTVLQEIKNELRLAKKTEDCGMDARMKCYIKFTDGKIDSLCTDEFFSYGYYNEKPVSLTNKFVYLIRQNCGFYNWIGVDYMKYFDELNDTTFVREKVKSRFGEEY